MFCILNMFDLKPVKEVARTNNLHMHQHNFALKKSLL